MSALTLSYQWAFFVFIICGACYSHYEHFLFRWCLLHFAFFSTDGACWTKPRGHPRNLLPRNLFLDLPSKLTHLITDQSHLPSKLTHITDQSLSFFTARLKHIED